MHNSNYYNLWTIAIVFKRYILATLVLFICFKVSHAQVGINTTNPSDNAALEINADLGGGNYGGLLPPKFTAAQKSTLTSMLTANDDGMIIYLIDGTTRCLQMYNATDTLWQDIYCMPFNTAPVANAVTFTGTLQAGQLLTGNYTYFDVEADIEGVSIQNFYAADDASGTNEVLISTSNMYVLDATQVNKYIRYAVQPVATTGTINGLLTYAAYQGPVVAAPSTVHFSENFDAFQGSGFTSSPSPAQLDSNIWRVDTESGTFAYGGSGLGGDYARGPSTGGESTGGTYAFDIGSGDYTLGFQAAGGDYTSGFIELRVQNTTGISVSNWTIDYDIVHLNDQGRSTSLNVSYSTDGVIFTSIPTANFNSPVAATAGASWVTTNRNENITPTIVNGGYIYIRWDTDDNAGSGSRDELGLNNINIIGN